MKRRSLAIALISFCLGMVTLWAVSTKTSWLRFLHKQTEFRVVNTTDLSWVRGQGAHATYFMKFLHNDANSGQVSMLLRYPAGQIVPAHKHSFGHGMYVLQGKLVTHRGTFGPGAFVWFPANEVVSHGASTDEEVIVLFLRNEDMDINYVEATAP